MASADAQLRNASVQYNREIFSPRSRTAPGGMGVPNLFDQMFTRPMESFIGERSTGRRAERGPLSPPASRSRRPATACMRLQAELQALDAKLRDARSIAPFDGVMVKKFVEVGDTVQPGQPLLGFADIEFLQVEVDVPARLRPGLSEGMMLSRRTGREPPPGAGAGGPDLSHGRRPAPHGQGQVRPAPGGLRSRACMPRCMVPDFECPGARQSGHPASRDPLQRQPARGLCPGRQRRPPSCA